MGTAAPARGGCDSGIATAVAAVAAVAAKTATAAMNTAAEAAAARVARGGRVAGGDGSMLADGDEGGSGGGGGQINVPSARVAEGPTLGVVLKNTVLHGAIALLSYCKAWRC